MTKWGRQIVTGAAVDLLERRVLASIDVIAKKGTLNVVGTDGDDAIRVAPHPVLINVLDVSVTTGASVDHRFLFSSSIRAINILGQSGNDTITVDDGLIGLARYMSVSIDAGDGNDIVKPGPFGGNVRLGAGDDQLTRGTDVDYAALNVSGGDGNDQITAASMIGRVDGDGGNDRIAVDSASGPVTGGDGDDTIDVRTADGWISGNAGNDLITGLGYVRIGGDAGNDILRLVKDGRGTLAGGDGDDVLDAGVNDGGALLGGPGNDRLYSSTNTDGYGEAGRDWFEPDAGWRTTDYSPKTDYKWGSPVPTGQPHYSPIGGSYSGATTTSVFRPSSVTDRLLVPLGRLGYCVVDETSDVYFSGRPAYPGSRSVSVPTSAGRPDLSRRPTSFPSLTRDERRPVLPGLLLIPSKWKLSPPVAAKDGLVWYDIRKAGTSDGVYFSDYRSGTLYQLCVKQGTILITDAERATASTMTSIQSVPAALHLPAGSSAMIAGEATAYRLATEAPSMLDITGIPGRRAILVDHGVIWLTLGDAMTEFVAS